MGVAAPFLLGAAKLLAFVAASSVASAVMRDISSPGTSKQAVSNGHLLTKRDHQEALPVIYGRCRVGVNQVYISTTGDSNRYLHMVCAIGEGPLHGIVRQDGTTYETTGSALPTSNPPLVYLDNTLWTEFAAKSIRIEFFDGSATQGVCSTLSAACPEWQDALRNTAYIYIRLEYDRYKYMSDPGSITLVVDGLEVYDPVTLLTGWTNNPAICAYNYMTRTAQRGGMGLPTTWYGHTALIDDTSVSDFKGYCAAKGWTCNLPITDNVAVADNLALILAGGRGRPIQSGGKFKMCFADINYESVVKNITEEEIVVGSDGASTLSVSKPDVMDTPNTVRLKWLNSTDYKYTVDDYVMTDDAALEDDGGDVREVEIDVRGLSDLDKVQAMAAYHLERERFNLTASGTFGPSCLCLEPMDLVTITFPSFGWDQKYFRVTATAPQTTGAGQYTVQLTLIEEDDALYDDNYDPAELEWFSTTLPDPSAAPLSVHNVTAAEETYTERGRSRTRLVVDFDPPSDVDDPFWHHAEIWVKRGSGDWRYMTTAGENDGASGYVLDPVEEGETYYVKLVSVSMHGRKEGFDSAYSVSRTIQGMTADPANLSALTAISNGGNVTLFARWSGDDDVDSFEIRSGDSWNDGTVIMVAPAHNNDLRATVNGFRPGTHKFWAAALNNAGNYSSAPVSATVAVYLPQGYTELPTYGSWTWDFSSGYFSNTEQVTHTFDGSSADALKCSHDYFTYDMSFNDGTVMGFSSPNMSLSNYNNTHLQLSVTSVSEYDTAYCDSYSNLVFPFVGKTWHIVRIPITRTAGSTQTFRLHWATREHSFSYDYRMDFTTDEPLNDEEMVILDMSNPSSGGSDWIDSEITGIRLVVESPSVGDTYRINYFAFLGTAPLKGLWESPTHDLGAVETVRVWGDFVTHFSGSGQAWSDRLQAGKTWAEHGLGSGGSALSWNDIFTLAASGKLRATLKAQDTDSGWDSAPEFDFFEMQSAEIKNRYVRVVVVIEDPTFTANLYLKELKMYAYQGPTEVS